MEINSKNVGRIAERIAMNEFEARGFHIIDLAYMSKTSANVDFIASKNGASFNVQVKGASNPVISSSSRWWVQFGHCDESMIAGEKPAFNGKSDFALKADTIVLLAVNSPSNYRGIIMPLEVAEQVAQLNMDGYYRQTKDGGGKRQPGKLWIELEPAKNPRKHNQYHDDIRSLLSKFEGAWELGEAN